MNTNKEICFVLVGDICTLIESKILIGFACVNDLYVGVILFNVVADFQGDFEGHILFPAFLSQRTRIVTAMSGINDDDIDFKLGLDAGTGRV